MHRIHYLNLRGSRPVSEYGAGSAQEQRYGAGRGLPHPRPAPGQALTFPLRGKGLWQHKNYEKSKGLQ